MGFYKEVYLGILKNERKDYRKVPSRQVYRLYQIYQGLPTAQARLDFRAQNEDLDAWGVLYFGWTPIEDRGSKTSDLSGWEDLARRMAELKGRIGAL